MDSQGIRSWAVPGVWAVARGLRESLGLGLATPDAWTVLHEFFGGPGSGLLGNRRAYAGGPFFLRGGFHT